MSTEIERHCYVGRQPGCGCIGVVVVDSQEHAKDTAKTVSDAVKAGLEIERMTVVAFRESNDQFGCKHELKMKKCRDKGLNIGGSKEEST